MLAGSCVPSARQLYGQLSVVLFLLSPLAFGGAATQTKCGISRTQSAACKAPSRMTWFLRARGAAKPKPRRRMGSFQVLVDPFRSPVVRQLTIHSSRRLRRGLIQVLDRLFHFVAAALPCMLGRKLTTAPHPSAPSSRWPQVIKAIPLWPWCRNTRPPQKGHGNNCTGPFVPTGP